MNSRELERTAPVLSAVWRFLGAAGIATALGYFLDRRFGTSPWVLLACMCAGLSVGFYAFYKTLAGPRR